MQKPLRQAAISGDAEIVRKFLDDGSDIDQLDKYGQTALMLAAVRGHAGVVEALVAAGANLDVTAKYGLSALMLAIVNKHADVAGLLIGAKADIWLRGSGAPGFANKTAFDLARASDLTDVMDLLKSAAAHEALALIQSAFADRAPPTVLSDSKQLSDVEYEEVMVFDGMRWRDIEMSHVERGADAVFWFSPEAFCYYIPGFLTASLRENSLDSNAFDSIIGCLDRSPEPDNWDDFFAPRFTRFSIAELDAIAAWVRWVEMMLPDGFHEFTYGRVHDTLELLKLQAQDRQ